MNEEEIKKLVMVLIGSINPVGDSAIDSVRRENINKLIELVKELHSTLSDVWCDTRDSKFGSVIRVKNDLDAYFDWMGIKEETK